MHRSGYRLAVQIIKYRINKDIVVYAFDFVKENKTGEKKTPRSVSLRKDAQSGSGGRGAEGYAAERVLWAERNRLKPGLPDRSIPQIGKMIPMKDENEFLTLTKFIFCFYFVFFTGKSA